MGELLFDWRFNTPVAEIKSMLSEVNSKLDSLLEEKDTCALTAWKRNLKDFLEGEPDIYSVKDMEAKIKGN